MEDSPDKKSSWELRTKAPKSKIMNSLSHSLLRHFESVFLFSFLFFFAFFSSFFPEAPCVNAHCSSCVVAHERQDYLASAHCVYVVKLHRESVDSPTRYSFFPSSRLYVRLG